jgi:soluble epoxide hydrolase/lipid-phosphate phosphatase
MFHALCVFTTGLLLSRSANVLAVSVFNPGGFDINAVTCPAIDRVLNQTVNIIIGEYNAAYMRFAR